MTHTIETSAVPGNSDVRGLSALDIVVFCILAGVVSTFAGGYTYGQNNQVEHLPMMFRMVDAGYLRGDFFVDSTTEFNPRFYYISLMAILAHVVSPPVLFLLLTCGANALIAGVTWYAARSLSVRSDWVPIVACALVMSVSAFNVGGAAHLTRPFLDQALLARPFAMLGLWLTITGSLRSATLLFAVAIVVHPLVGMETAAVALGAAATDAGVTFWKGGLGRAQVLGRLRSLAIVALVLALAGYLLYYDLYRDAHTLDTERFIHILAETRAPHYFLPSQFGVGSYLAFGVFCWAALWSWHRWRPTDQTGTARSILAAGAIVGLACLGGYVFVEVVPTRLGTTAMPFRLVYVIKWLGLLMFAVVAGPALTRSQPLATRVGGALLILGVGRFQPAVALLGHVSTLVGQSFRGRRATIAVSACAAAAGIALVVAPAASVAEEPLVLGLLLGVGASLLFIRSSRWRRWLPTGVVAIGVALLIFGRTSPVAAVWAGAVGVRLPQVTLDDSRHGWSPAARFAREHTEPDAIFVIPPVGGFRLEAERAVVVDFKVAPFGDAHLSEWYERMQLTYQGSLDDPLSDLPVLSDRYARISDDRLLALRRRYGATHALLPKQTRSRMAVLYEDDRYKINRIESVP